MRRRYEIVFQSDSPDNLPTTRQLYDSLEEGLRFDQGFTCPMNVQEHTTEVDRRGE